MASWDSVMKGGISRVTISKWSTPSWFMDMSIIFWSICEEYARPFR